MYIVLKAQQSQSHARSTPLELPAPAAARTIERALGGCDDAAFIDFLKVRLLAARCLSLRIDRSSCNPAWQRMTCYIGTYVLLSPVPINPALFLAPCSTAWCGTPPAG